MQEQKLNKSGLGLPPPLPPPPMVPPTQVFCFFLFVSFSSPVNMFDPSLVQIKWPCNNQGSHKPPPPNVMDVFPKKLAVKVVLTWIWSFCLVFFCLFETLWRVKVPAPEAPVPVSFIKDADKDHEADSQRERERKRFLTNSAMGVVSVRLWSYNVEFSIFPEGLLALIMLLFALSTSPLEK